MHDLWMKPSAHLYLVRQNQPKSHFAKRQIELKIESGGKKEDKGIDHIVGVQQ